MEVGRAFSFDESPIPAQPEKYLDKELRVFDPKLQMGHVPRSSCTEHGDGNVSLCLSECDDGTVQKAAYLIKAVFLQANVTSPPHPPGLDQQYLDSVFIRPTQAGLCSHTCFIFVFSLLFYFYFLNQVQQMQT